MKAPTAWCSGNPVGILSPLLILCALLTPLCCGGDDELGPEETAAAVERAISRGVEYLVETQRENGSWGSPATNLHDIYAPVPGSQRTFQVASAALAVAALIEVGGDSAEVDRTIERAREFLLEHHAVRRIRANTLYNVWANIYALEAFARFLARETDPELRVRLRKASREAIDLLQRFEFVEGGWGYYNFDVMGRRPGQGATAFTTASGLVALKMVADQGVEVPKKLVRRGERVIRLSESTDNAFAYSLSHRFNPTRGINKVKGSLARTPVCLLAMDDWNPGVDQKRIHKALRDLETYGHFLRIARKYPIPHEAWYQNSGYFCFYGYYYATLLLERLPEDERPVYQGQIARQMVKLQEQDGSFWDYQLFNYHKVYGTGYVLMTLGRCRTGS